MSRRAVASLIAILCACAVSRAEAAGSIRRDTYGIPHILAATEPEAAFLHGYATAEDHLALIARLYLRAQSRQSEFFGPDFVEEDFYFKQLEIQERAAHALASLPPLMRQIVERYADGYNAFLRKAGAQAPPYAQPIQAVDVLAHCYAVLMVDFNLVPRPERIAAAESAPAASNVWLLGGRKTVSGHGMLLANPHLRWEGAFTLHEVHIRVPGRIDVYGVAFVGSPVVSIGFNPWLGWSHTVNQVDVTDIYRLTLDDAKTSYRYDETWRPLQSRTATIRVRTQDGLREERRVFWRSHQGPIMRMSGSTAYAMKTAVGDDGGFLVQWHEMAKARSLAEFRAALDIQGLPTYNVGYADREGHVYFLAGGRVPIRPPGYDWAGVVPGDTSRTEWDSLHPIGELPQKLDPGSGYLQNANEPPWFVNRAEPIAAAAYPKYMTAGALSARAIANLDLLESRSSFTLDDVIRAKFNAKSYVAASVQAELIAALRGAPAVDGFQPVVAVLEKWDGAMGAVSRGAVLFNAWWEDYSKKAKPVFTGPPTASHLGDAAQAVRSVQSAVEQLVKRGLTLDTAWGDVYRFQRGAVDLPMSGCAFVLGCVRAMAFRPGSGGKQAAYFGDTFVLAVEFDRAPRAYGVLAYSESSNPASPHFNDQAELFAADRLRPIWFSEEQIQAHQQSVEQMPDEVTNVRRQP